MVSRKFKNSSKELSYVAWYECNKKAAQVDNRYNPGALFDRKGSRLERSIIGFQDGDRWWGPAWKSSNLEPINREIEKNILAIGSSKNKCQQIHTKNSITLPKNTTFPKLYRNHLISGVTLTRNWRWMIFQINYQSSRYLIKIIWFFHCLEFIFISQKLHKVQEIVWPILEM
jgi:hypothetical protein